MGFHFQTPAFRFFQKAQQAMGMEGLKQKKTVYLEALENLFQELTLARSISSGGRKLMLLGVLYDIHRVHQFFLQIESNLSESIEVHNLLQYDADVDYAQWSAKLDIKFDVNAFFLPDEEDEDADVDSVKTTLWHAFDTFSRDALKNISCDRTGNVRLIMDILTNDLSAEQLVLVLNESVVALREILYKIHTCISKHRMTLEEGEELYRYERTLFAERFEKDVEEDFERWKDQFDDDEDVLKRNLRGKYRTEMLYIFMSGFLASRISAQSETDTSEFDAEYEQIKIPNIPPDMDAKAHYSALRELFDYKDGIVVPKKGHIGKFFFKHRKEVTLEHRVALFRFIKMIWLIEEEKKPKPKHKELNHEGVKVVMIRTHFPKCESALCEGYDKEWLSNYMTALMESKYRDSIAMDWGNSEKNKQVYCAIIGALKEKGVFKGSYASLARLVYGKSVDDETDTDKKEQMHMELRTLEKYIGNGKKHIIGKWTEDYVSEA